MTLSTLPLSYCTNVHPGRSVREVEQGLDDCTRPLSQNLAAPLAAGLWLADPVATELLVSRDRLNRFAEGLARRDLTCYTLNAFPFGDFHSVRVKQNVYQPDWAEPQRLRYTINCATILAGLLPSEGEGSISTMPLAYKDAPRPADFLDRSMSQLIQLSRYLQEVFETTGKTIRLAIEPEPLCVLETTGETLAFFEQLWQRADDHGDLEAVRTHVGVCYDVCHQAVEFEDVAESIRSIDQAGVRINKVHITCALELNGVAENIAGRKSLARYVEPRYLHQAFARGADGKIAHVDDLTEKLALEPGPEFLEARQWRIHFHVPVDAEHMGPLDTTRPELRRALATVSELCYAPHLEVETYTWNVMPGAAPTNLIDGLTRELTATEVLLSSLTSPEATASPAPEHSR